MKDAYGGILNIMLIVVFFVIIEGILGMIVNYTKAFKMKNTVIAALEKYEANTSCFTNSSSSCYKHIVSGAKRIGYSPSKLRCPNGYTKAVHNTADGAKGLYCWKLVKHDTVAGDSGNRREAYRIITQVDVDLPIVKDILGLSFFQVTGDTRMIVKVRGN